MRLQRANARALHTEDESNAARMGNFLQSVLHLLHIAQFRRSVYCETTKRERGGQTSQDVSQRSDAVMKKGKKNGPREDW
jgi:hypothetical protein